MAAEYSVQTCRHLAERFRRTGVLRPLRVSRYDAGTELTYDVTGVFPPRSARVTVAIDRFVGGGFAGQVYRVAVKRIEGDGHGIEGLAVGGPYAMKILVPPSRRSEVFRNAIYALGFQSAFQLQVNPAAARAGALWQKFIRRAAKMRFGGEQAVVDIFATFVDPTIGSCGEIREWLEGRTWRFEVDDRLFARWRWGPGDAADGLGSPEYRAKKQFMADLVDLLHEMGAPELARQYEWWTCKSQPNCLKRYDCEGDPAAGLTAVDFRAGLALLACLPMSPGDVKLIFRGLARGRIVQFDRGDLDRLEKFVRAGGEELADMRPALEELRAAEAEYHDSQIDVAAHHVRLLHDGGLWRRIRRATVTGWRVRGEVDDRAERRLRAGAMRTAAFWLLGLVPLLGSALRKMWGRADYRAHYARLLAGGSYLRQAIRAHVAEELIGWHRDGRASVEVVGKLCDSPALFFLFMPLSLLPAGLHRMLMDEAYALAKLRYVFVRPLRLYFNREAREQWLREMVAEGRKNHMVTDEDAEHILAGIREPFIQKYLKSLAVHVCTLPVTQIVSVAVAAWYYFAHPGLSPAQRAAAVGAILVAFQITPISPGSLVRGLYVLYLVIRERDFRNYNIAVFLGFFKYVGYLAFPIQMAYHYPALARFMAGHWATGAAHVVPVFGEKGALLEHFVFDLFYNYPLTIRRRMRRRAERRAGLAPRRWHALICLVGAAGLLAAIDAAVWAARGVVPTWGDVWYLAIWPPLLAGAAAAIWAGGSSTPRRILLALLVGLNVALLHSLASTALAGLLGSGQAAGTSWLLMSWSVVRFPLLAALGAILVETHGPEPK